MGFVYGFDLSKAGLNVLLVSLIRNFLKAKNKSAPNPGTKMIPNKDIVR